MIWNNYIKKWQYIHRIIATLFIENPNNYSDVNHLDGDKGNNKADNLQWCSKSMNTQHAFRTGLMDKMIAINKKRLESYVMPQYVKDKMSVAKLGSKHYAHKYIYITPLGEFESLQIATEAHGTYRNKIYRQCKANKNGYSIRQANSFLPENLL